jgi:hypothetical protein
MREIAEENFNWFYRASIMSSEIMPARRSASADKEKSTTDTEKSTVDAEIQQHGVAPTPTEAIRKLWTKSPLMVAFGG